jgi:SAM-dependent methyltransferase
VSLNPPTQYATESNLQARQRLWQEQRPPFDLVAWVLDIAGLDAGTTGTVLDLGCGNGRYLAGLRSLGINAVGCDLSAGMLEAARPHPLLANGDATRLPFSDDAFDVVLAPHMLYHVDDRVQAVAELRRVTKPGGRCVVVTNGEGHMRALREVVEHSVRQATSGWVMRDPATHAFSLQNGAEQLRTAFDHVECVRPDGAAPVQLTDAAIVADYVRSVADHYQPQTTRPWRVVVDEVNERVQNEIAANGVFVITGETGAFVCR